jgi:hypothetical protein
VTGVQTCALPISYLPQISTNSKKFPGTNSKERGPLHYNTYESGISASKTDELTGRYVFIDNIQV